MASFTCDGLEHAIMQLERLNLFDEDTKREMLFAAGDILVDEARRELSGARYRVSGMAEGVKYRRSVKTDRLGRPYISVSIYGKTAEGAPRSKAAFVLNYGRQDAYGRIHGDYFWTKARETASPKIAQKLREIADEKLRERGLI